MPRSNRPRRSASGRGDDDESPTSLAPCSGMRTPKPNAMVSGRCSRWPQRPRCKYYTCPGCGIEIPPGAAHIVAWRADGLMGEADDIAARRHWHTHCWKIK